MRDERLARVFRAQPVRVPYSFVEQAHILVVDSEIKTNFFLYRLATYSVYKQYYSADL